MVDRPGRRRFPWVALPTVLLLVAAAGWSALWFYSASRAGTVIDSWLKRESAQGRQVDCVDRTVGGFPFEIEVRCREISLTLPGDAAPVVARAAGFIGVAQIYDPRHVIIELKGPLLLGTAGAAAQTALSWSLAEASVIGAPSAADQRLSVVLENPAIGTAGKTDDPPFARAAHLEFHARHDPETPDAIDVVAAATKITAPALQGSFGGPLDSQIQFKATGIAAVRRASLSDLLRHFAAADGRLDIALLRLTAPDLAAEGRGNVSLDAQGRPEGTLTVTGRIAPSFLDAVLGRRNAGVVHLGFGLLGEPAVLGGKRATTLRLVAKDGTLMLGPLAVGDLPSLY
jgi:hypothetical protein